MAEKTSWDWPDELDALVAAPENHHLLLENDQVRVIETQVPVRATTPVHTHRWASVEYVLSTTDFIRRDGRSVEPSRPRPTRTIGSAVVGPASAPFD